MSHSATPGTTGDAGSSAVPKLSLWENYREAGYGYERPKRGDLATGTVLEVSPRAVWVDIGAKRDGLVPAHDLERLGDGLVDALEVGEKVPVLVVRPRNRQGRLQLSLAQGRQFEDWKRATELLRSEGIAEYTVTRSNKGGVVVAFGQLRGFVPASHLEAIPRRATGEERTQILTSLVGSALPLQVIEVERAKRRLVLSHRLAHRRLREERKHELLELLSVGDVRQGKVVSLRQYGAFVDIGGADGLVHVSEISHRRLRHPSEVLTPGQEIEVYVLKIDHDRERIALSIKRLLPDPWHAAGSMYHPDMLTEAVVTNIVPFGAFAKLESGIEGLIHISELSHEHVDHPSDVLAVGDVVTVRILRIDTDRRRIGLSLKRAPQWVEIELSAVEERAARDVTSLTKDATEIQGQPQVAIAVDSQDSTESSLTPGATAASDTLTTPDLSGGESKIRVEEFTSLAAMA